MSTAQPWFVYIILTNQGSYYTGITTEVERRFKEHQDTANKIPKAKGAKFFRTARPLRILRTEQFPSRSEASKREAEIKAMSPPEKNKLVQSKL